MYKVIVEDFKGYRRMIVHNTLKGHFFYYFQPDFYHLWDCPYAEVIACIEDGCEKFYSLEEAKENSMIIVERRCGYKKEIPMEEIDSFCTIEIPRKDVEMWRKGEIYG
jgi:hypothetical protein